mmetsp:Transcript_1217/g.3724  ORF Transcript_1217/g.3724 Transcript_1217/m.3724 type:complete len:291 (+) Transcript_1217:1056-1928(+)
MAALSAAGQAVAHDEARTALRVVLHEDCYPGLYCPLGDRRVGLPTAPAAPDVLDSKPLGTRGIVAQPREVRADQARLLMHGGVRNHASARGDEERRAEGREHRDAVLRARALAHLDGVEALLQVPPDKGEDDLLAARAPAREARCPAIEPGHARGRRVHAAVEAQRHLDPRLLLRPLQDLPVRRGHRDDRGGHARHRAGHEHDDAGRRQAQRHAASRADHHLQGARLGDRVLEPRLLRPGAREGHALVRRGVEVRHHRHAALLRAAPQEDEDVRRDLRGRVHDVALLPAE